MAALPHFVAAASSLDGLTVTVMVRNVCSSLFAPNAKLDRNRPEVVMFGAWKPVALERMLRVTAIFALLAAGLSSDGQRLLWITDDDDIAANDRLHQDTLDTVVRVFTNIATHPIAHLEAGTTAADNGTLEIEDLAAIADLAAGASVEALQSAGTTTAGVLNIVERSTTKGVRIAHWLSTTDLPLKHVVIAIDPDISSQQLRFRRIQFGTMRRPRHIHLP
jgi:hypothetical protein